MVFAGLFPTDSDDYPDLRDALERLKLNDAALFYEPETSQALGFGFRCGFLGLLHMEIVRERLEREFDLDLIVTAPNVAYRVLTKAGEEVEVHNPSEMPREVEHVEEPYIKASIIVPKDYVGQVMELNTERRGRFDHMEYLSEERVLLVYELPLAEIVLDYYDQLKSRTRGYASFDYDVIDFREGKLERVDVLIAGEPVDALSLIVHRDGAYARGRMLVDRLREEIPRQFFDVAVQAAIGSRVIARETIKAKRKDVLAKCYGGDISPQAEAARAAEEGQEADEAGRLGRGAAGGVPRRAQPRREQEVSARHLYVHLPFCASRCGYCDFVTVVGQAGQHEAYVDALLAELALERRRAGAAARERLPRRRNADADRAARAGAAAARAAAGRGGDGRGEPGDGHARARRAAARGRRDARLARRAELPAASARGARAARAARGRAAGVRRPARGRLRQPLARPDLRDPRPEPGRPRRRPERGAGARSRSTSPRTSSRRSRGRASRTRTARSSRARPKRWSRTSSGSSTG